MTRQSDDEARRRSHNRRRRKARAEFKLVVNRAEIANGLPDRMLSMKEVLVMLSLRSPNTVQTMIREGRFPPPADLGSRVARWWYSDVVAAISKMRRKGGKPTLHRPAPAAE